MKNNKISIKDIMCDIKTINGTMFISDADVNRVLYPKTKRSTRGKKMSKEKLCNIENSIKLNGVLHFELETEHIDDCYHNNFIVK